MLTSQRAGGDHHRSAHVDAEVGGAEVGHGGSPEAPRSSMPWRHGRMEAVYITNVLERRRVVPGKGRAAVPCLAHPKHLGGGSTAIVARLRVVLVRSRRPFSRLPFDVSRATIATKSSRPSRRGHRRDARRGERARRHRDARDARGRGSSSVARSRAADARKAADDGGW